MHNIFIIIFWWSLLILVRVSGKALLDTQKVLTNIQTQHSLKSFQYGEDGGSLWNWIPGGSTSWTNEYIRLTNDSDQFGSLWNSVPVTMRDWQMEWKFRIHGPKRTTGGGSGLILWYISQQNQMNLNFTGLSVLIDTKMEGKEKSGGEKKSKGDQIYSMVTGALRVDGVTKFDGCTAHIRNSRSVTMLRIRYANQLLTVWTNTHDEHKWDTCLRFKVDLPLNYHFSFSASTSNSSLDKHDLISVKTFELTPMTSYLLDNPVQEDEDTRSDHAILNPEEKFSEMSDGYNVDSKELEQLDELSHHELNDDPHGHDHLTDKDRILVPTKVFVVPVIIFISFALFCSIGLALGCRDKYEP